MGFINLLIITIILRGISVGIILGIGMLTNPVRHKIGINNYAKFIKVFYKGLGVKAYAIMTIVGALLTGLLLILSIQQQLTITVNIFLVFSLFGSAFGFIGTAGAFPTMNKLWATDDKEEKTLIVLLNKFEFWHWFSAIGHLTAFCTLVLVFAGIN